MTRILIVEDDLDIVEGLTDFLEARGYQLDFAYQGDHALTLLSDNVYDLVLLDVNLPRLCGLSVCEVLRQNKMLARLPVIMMTANDKSEDKLLGFEAGAWDYIVKPFSLKELAARIKVFSRLANADTSESVKFGDLSFNPEANTVTCNQQGLPLHATGLAILSALLKNAPGIVKQASLYHLVWGDSVPESDPLRAHIYKLRQILKAHQSCVTVKTVKGLGFSLENTTDEE